MHACKLLKNKTFYLSLFWLDFSLFQAALVTQKVQQWHLLTGTFFCVTTTAQSFPRTATDVSPPWFIALKAYSEKELKK